jgi:phospholipase/carboxylesterase
MASVQVKARRAHLGGLTCELLSVGGDAPQWAIVLCHGYGAPADDLVPVAQEWLALPGVEQLPPLLAALPAAPLAADPQAPGGGRAWWPLDMEEVVAWQASGQRGLDVLKRWRPEGLVSAREKLIALLSALSIPPERIILGGFSQGAMLATDVALRLDESPAALCIFSGSLICEEDWATLAPHRRQMAVFQSHGTMDPLLPYSNAVALRKLLESSGVTVKFLPFQGGHGIPAEVLIESWGLLLPILLRAGAAPR